MYNVAELNNQAGVSGGEIGDMLMSLISKKDEMNFDQIKAMRELSLELTIKNIAVAAGENIKLTTLMKDQLEKNETRLMLLEEDKENMVKEINMLSGKVKGLRDEIRIDSREQERLFRKGKKRAFEILEVDKYYDHYKKYNGQRHEDLYRKVVSRLWNEMKKEYNVPSYKELKRTDFDNAMEFASKWKPSLYY